MILLVIIEVHHESHKYAYVHGDPVMGTDPSGMFSIGGSLSGMSMRLSMTAMRGGRLAITTYSLGSKVWITRMLASTLISAAMFGYSTRYLPPLWSELRGLADDVDGAIRAEYVDQTRVAADLVESAYWSIQQKNVIRIGLAATLAPWPKFRLGVGALNLVLGISQGKDFLYALQAQIVAINGINEGMGIPLKIKFEPTPWTLAVFALKGLTFQLDPDGQVKDLRKIVQLIKEGNRLAAARSLLALKKSLEDDYGDMIEIEFNPAAIPNALPGAGP